MNNKKAISTYKRLFEMALLEARRSPDIRKQVGCVIADANKDQIIALGYNGRPIADLNSHDCIDPTTGKSHPALLHAEERALLNAGYSRTKGAIMFVTHCPCIKCAARILESGIKAVYFLEDHDEGAGSKYLNDHGVKVMQVINIRKSIDRRVNLYDNTGLSSYIHEAETDWYRDIVIDENV